MEEITTTNSTTAQASAGDEPMVAAPVYPKEFKLISMDGKETAVRQEDGSYLIPCRESKLVPAKAACIIKTGYKMECPPECGVMFHVHILGDCDFNERDHEVFSMLDGEMYIRMDAEGRAHELATTMLIEAMYRENTLWNRLKRFFRRERWNAYYEYSEMYLKACESLENPYPSDVILRITPVVLYKEPAEEAETPSAQPDAEAEPKAPAKKTQKKVSAGTAKKSSPRKKQSLKRAQAQDDKTPAKAW